MSTHRISIIGAGLMGHGIAQTFAAAGHRVRVYDAFPGTLETAPARIEAVFELLGQDKAGLKNLSYHSGFDEAVADAEFVIEAVPEKPGLKQEIFEHLGRSAPAGAVLCTNTSAIPIHEVGARVADRSRVIGTHYWNPPHLVPLVEVVQSEFTSAEVVGKTMRVLESAGRAPVHVKRDIPGFIGNRLQHALKREAIALVAAGVCDARTLDTVVKEGFGARLAVLGPMEQSDLVGLNLTLDIHRVLIKDLDRTPGPHPYLEGKVAAGELGMSTGQGFIQWTPEEIAAVRARLNPSLVAAARERAARARVAR
ncbi:MAG: NAD(P)-binding domain-containing protein [Burkholderiales bacterium]|nr:NAD(P)-binding domain-containing protein [Burkholderiales bacterium]